MPKTKLESGSIKIEIEPDPIEVHSAEVRVLLVLLDVMREASLTTLEFDRRANSSIYDLTWRLADGREWKQGVKVEPGAEASMSFDVVDFWTLSTHDRLLPVRSHVIAMARNGMTKLKVTWT